MSLDGADSLTFIELLETLTQKLETHPVKQVIEIFATQAHIITEHTQNKNDLQQALRSFVNTILEKGGDESIDEHISAITQIAQERNIPLSIRYLCPEAAFMRQELIKAGVFETFEQFADGGIEHIHIDNTVNAIKYLVYLEYTITDIPSLARYLNVCIDMSQVNTSKDDTSIFDQYIRYSAVNSEKFILSDIRNTYPYLYRDDTLARDYTNLYLTQGVARKDIEEKVELVLNKYAWIENMVTYFSHTILAPRATGRNIDGGLENLSETEISEIHRIINDWLDSFDPSRYMPLRFPTNNPYDLALYEIIGGEKNSIRH